MERDSRDSEVDIVADMEVDMVADMEVDKVADMVADTKVTWWPTWWLTRRWTQWPTL